MNKDLPRHSPWYNQNALPMPTIGSFQTMTLFTGGIFHVTLKIEGYLSFGQYILSIRMKSPGGAGSPLASLSFPGESF